MNSQYPVLVRGEKERVSAHCTLRIAIDGLWEAS